MKWPRNLAIIRHGQSVYNALRQRKAEDELHQRFLAAFKHDPNSDKTRSLALQVKDRFALNCSDYETPLSGEGIAQACSTGVRLNKNLFVPDVVFVSPYLRTKQTFEYLCEGGFDIGEAKVVFDDRIREQEHGLSLLYSDWRVFHALHPDQRALYEMQGSYWYMYPQGESVSMVRDRIRLFFQMLVREHAGQNVLLVSHHLTKLSIMANLERWSPEKFIDVDENDKPVNCGITHYECNPDEGSDGRLVQKKYNLVLY